MLNFNRSTQTYSFALLLHVGMGVLLSAFRDLSVLYVLLVLLYFIRQIYRAKDKTYWVVAAAAYVAAGEVFFRMTKGVVLYESGKYAVILFMLLGFYYKGFKLNAWPIILFIGLLLPGIYVAYLTGDFIEESFRKSILFNFSGPLSLVATAIFCYQRPISFKQIMKIIDLMVLPLIAMTVYVVLYAPNLAEIQFTTEANGLTSGGYGSNQVSTMLGMAMFLTYVRFLIPHKTIWLKLINMGLLGLFAYRGLITFSRGGMITGLVMMLLFTLLFLNRAPLIAKGKAIIKLAGVSFGAVVLWGSAMAVTGGLIFNRYTGKDALGREKDLTTGRLDILAEELEAFFEHPIWGIGVGQGKFFRFEETGVLAASHNEVSRILAEHGSLGILALLILLMVPLFFFLSGSKNLFLLPFIAFWFLTINHSAMRIAAPGFFYGLALVSIRYKKRPSLDKERSSIKFKQHPRHA